MLIAQLSPTMLRFTGKLVPVIIALYASFASATTATWDAVTLDIDGNSESGISEYCVHYGTESGNYTDQVCVPGDTTTMTFENGVLEEGTSYYFAVTATDYSGNISDFSEEVSTVATRSSASTSASSGCSVGGRSNGWIWALLLVAVTLLCIRTRRRIGTASLLFFLLFAPSVQASELSTKAAALAPGQYATLTTGLTFAQINPPDGHTESILIWADSGAWDPVKRRFYYIGKHAGADALWRNIIYDADSNTWSTDNPAPPLTNGNGHGYDGTTADPVTGAHFWHPFASTEVYKYNGSGWTLLPPLPQNDVVGIAKSPTGLLYAGSNLDAYYPDDNPSGTWKRVNTSIPCGGYSGVTEYDPIHKVFFASNDNGLLCKIEIVAGAPVRTQLRSFPQGAGPSVSESSSGKGNMTADPVTGDLIVYIRSTGNFYAYNLASNSWATIGNVTDGKVPPLPSGGFTIAAPISTYGVIMYVSHDNNNSHAPTVHIYKYAPFTPDTTKPKAPTNLKVL